VNTVDAVLLDVGGVLVLPDPAVLLPVVRQAGAHRATAGDLARGHYAGIAAMDRSALDRGVTADWPAYNRALVDVLDLDDGTAEAVRTAVTAAYPDLRWTGVIPGAVEALRLLADTGVALGIVSNSNGTVEEQLLTSRICQVGEGEGVPVVVLLDSFVVGIEKPHPGIFELALDSLGVTADRAMHVGDTGWADVAGARAAGVRPVHLDPYGFCPLPDDHEHVRRLEGVAALVVASRP
jgi:putative hydrolase of the HAD superfamily